MSESQAQVRGRVSEKSAAILKTYFRSLNAGGEYLINMFPGLFERSLTGQKGVFEAKELELMIDSLKSVATHYGGKPMLNPEAAGFQMQNAVQINGGGDELLQKLRSLTLCDLVFLEVWAIGFWFQEERDIKAYCRTLA